MPNKYVSSMEPSHEMDSYFLKNLSGCFLDPSMHNTEFIVGAERQVFKCNATPLSIVSSVFFDILFNQTNQRKSLAKNGFTQVVLPNITPKGFAALLRYAISADSEVSPDNVVEVIHAAGVFRVRVMYKLALKYLSYLLEMNSKEYFLSYLEKASKLGLQVVVSHCMESVKSLEEVKGFLWSKEFGSFPAEFVSNLLSCNDLAIKEEDLWDCVVNWAEVQAKINNNDRLQILKKVYHKVRFPLMTAKYFSAKVVPTGVLTQKEILDLFCYLTHPERILEVPPFCSNPRVLWDNIEVRRYLTCTERRQSHDKGSFNQICVEVDRKCVLIAVGVFLGEGLTKCKVKIYKKTGKRRHLTHSTDGIQILRQEFSKEHGRLELTTPIKLNPGEIHEIVVHQVGPKSLRLKDGLSFVKEKRDDLEITFRWHKSGFINDNIPCIWVRLLSGS